MSLAEFLAYISGPGVAIAVGLILSYIISYVPAYAYLEPKFKRLAFLALCLLLPIGGALLRVAFGYVAFTIDPLLWRAIVAGAAAFTGGTLLHTKDLPDADLARYLEQAKARYVAGQ